ncbi:unnamed protein product [Amoebophrya sp. A25]|nr:unnamed protein product [Amoebophrya sp. A25]|eukprot:GSA25T00016618001.1
MSNAWQRLDDLWYRRREIGGMKWAEDPDRLWTHVICGARCGGPIAMVRDENVFQQLGTSTSLIPKLHTMTAMGSPLASVDWTFKGLLGLYWTPEEELVAVFSTGQVRIFDAFATQKRHWSLDMGSETRLTLVTFWTGGIVVFGATTKRLYVNLGFSRRSPVQITDAIDAFPGLITAGTSAGSSAGGSTGRGASMAAQEHASDFLFAAVTICVMPVAHEQGSGASSAACGRANTGSNAAGGSDIVQEIDVHASSAVLTQNVFALLNSTKADLRVLLATEWHGVFVCSPQNCYQLGAGGEQLPDGGAPGVGPPQAVSQGQPQSYQPHTGSSGAGAASMSQHSGHGGPGPRGASSSLPLAVADPTTHFAVSPSGFFLALLTEKGAFKVYDNRLALLDVAQLESRKKPRQMVWVGEDCVALYMAATTKQHALFVGGPRNDWIPYQYDHPLFLISEIDGARVVGQKCEMLHRIPAAVEAIYSIGSCEPPAMLCYALERFVEGDVRAEESLRAIKDDLYDAINQTMDAAMCEFDEDNVSSLLQASVFGRTFLGTCMSSSSGASTSDSAQARAEEASRRFVECCKWIRIASALRNEYDLPVTCAQLQQIGLPALVSRLTARRQHLIAKRVCDWVGLPMVEKILVSWARDKIQHSPAITDADLSESIRRKFSQHASASKAAGGGGGSSALSRSASSQSQTAAPVKMVRYRYCARPPQSSVEELPVIDPGAADVPYAEVAEYAAQAHRPALATMLLKNEPQPAQQVAMLLKLSEFQLAFELAAQPKGDPELLRECLNHGSDSSTEVLISNTRARCLHIHSLRKLQRWPELQAFCEGGYPQKRLIAEALLRQAHAPRSVVAERVEFLQKTAVAFGQKSSVAKSRPTPAPSNIGAAQQQMQQQPAAGEKDHIPPDHFSAAVTQEQASLLKVQEALELKAKAQNWPTLPQLDPPNASVSAAGANSFSSSGSSSSRTDGAASSSSSSSGQQHASSGSSSNIPNYLFLGRSLMQTVRILLLLGQLSEADKLRKEFAIPEKRFWCWRIRALCEARNLDEIVAMARSGRGTQDYVPLVEALIQLNRPDLGKEFVSQIKDDQKAAALLLRMGYRKEAEELKQSKGMGGGILNWFKGSSSSG